MDLNVDLKCGSSVCLGGFRSTKRFFPFKFAYYFIIISNYRLCIVFSLFVIISRPQELYKTKKTQHNVTSLRFFYFLDLIQNFIKVTAHTMSLNLRLQYSSPPQGYHRSISSPQPSSSATLPSRGQSGPKYL